MSEMDDLLAEICDVEPGPYMFTLHVDFTAKSGEEAIVRAEQYAHALTLLRPEVDSFRARMSTGSDWSSSIAVFCNAAGPDQLDVCVDRFGHPGRHHGPGASGSWTDEEIPSASDSPGEQSS